RSHEGLETSLLVTVKSTVTGTASAAIALISSASAAANRVVVRVMVMEFSVGLKRSWGRNAQSAGKPAHFSAATVVAPGGSGSGTRFLIGGMLRRYAKIAPRS